MITNYNLGQEVEVRFIGRIIEAKLDSKLGVLYKIDGEDWMQALGIKGDCLFKLAEPGDFSPKITPAEIEGKLE